MSTMSRTGKLLLSTALVAIGAAGGALPLILSNDLEPPSKVPASPSPTDDGSGSAPSACLDALEKLRRIFEQGDRVYYAADRVPEKASDDERVEAYAEAAAEAHLLESRLQHVEVPARMELVHELERNFLRSVGRTYERAVALIRAGSDATADFELLLAKLDNLNNELSRRLDKIGCVFQV